MCRDLCINGGQNLENRQLGAIEKHPKLLLRSHDLLPFGQLFGCGRDWCIPQRIIGILESEYADDRDDYNYYDQTHEGSRVRCHFYITMISGCVQSKSRT